MASSWRAALTFYPSSSHTIPWSRQEPHQGLWDEHCPLGNHTADGPTFIPFQTTCCFLVLGFESDVREQDRLRPNGPTSLKSRQVCWTRSAQWCEVTHSYVDPGMMGQGDRAISPDRDMLGESKAGQGRCTSIQTIVPVQRLSEFLFSALFSTMCSVPARRMSDTYLLN